MSTGSFAIDYTDIQVFLRLDVGKTSHWATAVDSAGEVLWSKALPKDQPNIQAICGKLASYRTLLVVVDQPPTIGALAVATAQAAQISVAYLPGLATQRIADLCPGNAKTDTRDAFISAQAARTMPHTLRQLQISDEEEAALQMLTGFDQDLPARTNQTINRIRGLYLHIHPALERFLGSHLTIVPCSKSSKRGQRPLSYARPDEHGLTPNLPNTEPIGIAYGRKNSSRH